MTKKIGPYELKGKLGQGGFATVWRAYDPELDRDIALKVLEPELARDPERVKRFRQGARMAARLTHPHIITIHEVKQYGNLHCISMAYISRGSLRDYLAKKTNGRLSWTEAVSILQQITAGLDYAHRQGVIHRDLKPSNVMMDGDGRVVLVDFGVARHVIEEDTRSLTTNDGVVGTPNYIPLEVWDGGKGDARADIYGLGCIAYEMLTGAKLFAGTPMTAMRAHDRGAQFKRALPADTPAAVRPVLEKAVARNAADRYQTAAEFRTALNQLGHQGMVDDKPDSTNRIGDERVPYESTSLRSIEAMISIVGSGIVLLLLLIWGVSSWFGEPTVEHTFTLPPAQSEAIVPTFTLTPLPSETPTPTLTPTATPKPGAGDVRVVTLPKGGAVAMVFVPEGAFTMGSEAEEVDNDERPEHEVFVVDFWLDQTEVTNEQFAAFVADTGYDNVGSSASEGDYPVTDVSWYDAASFCAWRDARLPTESEWEKAARGVDGRIYPWGDMFGTHFANMGGEDDGYDGLAPVGSFSPNGDSPYGAQDMTGNVWEWTSSLYVDYPYEDDLVRTSDHPSEGDLLVLRGGSSYYFDRYVSAHDREGVLPTNRNYNVGFRCASHLP